MRTAICVLSLAVWAGPAAAQDVRPPEPLPMGVPYLYQPGNPYWFRPLAPPPLPAYYLDYPVFYAQTSYYPLGTSSGVIGRYSWDYNVYYTYGPGGWPNYLPQPPYWVAAPGAPYLPPRYNYMWKGFAY
jgi:hypothetical protein